MKERDLKIRTKRFAHDCVKIAVLFPKNNLIFELINKSRELTSIFISSRKTAQTNSNEYSLIVI